VVTKLPSFSSFSGVEQRLKIGVWLEPVSPALSAQLGIDTTEAVLVSRVADDGPADHAGMKSYDLIVEVNGERVDGLHAVSQALADMEEGQRLKVIVLRAGKRVALNIEPELGSHAHTGMFEALSGDFGGFPNVQFFGDDGDIAVFGAEIGEHALEVNEEALREVQEELREIERRLRELEGGQGED